MDIMIGNNTTSDCTFNNSHYDCIDNTTDGVLFYFTTTANFTPGNIHLDFKITYDFPHYVIYICMIVVSVLGLLANILNICAIINIQKGLTPHSKLIISLGVADSCIAIYGMHLSLSLGPLAVQLLQDYTNCLTVIFGLIFQPFFVTASLLNLLAIAFDHYFAIVKPLHYKSIMSRGRTNIVILLIWLLSMTVGSLEIIAAIFANVPKEWKSDYLYRVCGNIIGDSFHDTFTYSIIGVYFFVIVVFFCLNIHLRTCLSRI